MKDIIKGHFNELFGKEEELSAMRMEICKNCPLLIESKLGPRCNPNLYIEVAEPHAVSEKPLEGYVPGCNCRLEAKTRVPENHCPAGKW